MFHYIFVSQNVDMPTTYLIIKVGPSHFCDMWQQMLKVPDLANFVPIRSNLAHLACLADQSVKVGS